MVVTKNYFSIHRIVLAALFLYDLLLQTTDLLTFDPGTVPIVKRTSKGEFLVNAGTFGVIAVANGISNVSHVIICEILHVPP